MGARKEMSVLVMTRQPDIMENIKSSLSGIPSTRVTDARSGIAEMNGRALAMMRAHDVILVDVAGGDEIDLSSLQQIAGARRPDGFLVALTDSSMQLGQARELMRAGVDEVIPLTSLRVELAEMLSRASQRRGRVEEAPQRLDGDGGSVILVLPARGGVGATTTAVNLAYGLLGHQGFLRKTSSNRVALVDLDLQFGDAGLLLDLEDQGGMLHLAQSEEIPGEAFLRMAMCRHKSGLSVLPAARKVLPLDALRPEQVAGMLDALSATHDYVVVDMPRLVTDWIEPALRRAARIYLVTELTVPGIRQARRLLDCFMEDHLGLPVEIVVAREAKPMLRRREHAEAAEILKFPIAHWLPDDADITHEAAERGRPVVETRSGSGLGRAFGRLAKATIEALPIAQPETV